MATTWFVDSITGGVARLVCDSRVTSVPAVALPRDAREGDALEMVEEKADSASRFRIVRAASAAGRDAARRDLHHLSGTDPGGDLDL